MFRRGARAVKHRPRTVRCFVLRTIEPKETDKHFPRDPTIREKFNTYRFADYKESCIELLGRVVAVSVETVKISEAMKAAKRE